MRTLIRMTAAMGLMAGATIAAAPAFAGFDEAGENSFWTHQSVNPQPAAEARGSSSRNSEYKAIYDQQGNPAQASQAPTAAAAQKDPPYFYHAMGTMGTQ